MTTASKDVRTFRADSVNEAIVKVKMEMGDDAEIVETREITEGGFLGFFGETRFEVDAYVPNGSPSQNGRSSSGRSDRSATGSRNGDPDREKLRERIESLSRQMQDSNGTSNGTDTGARTAPAKSPSAEDEAGHEWNVDDPAMPEFSARERAKQLIEDQSDELGDLDSNGSGTYDRTGVGSNNGSPESADPAPSENPSSNPSSPIDSSRNKQEIEQLMEQTDLIAEKVDNLMDSVENETATKEQSASPDFPGELDDLYHQLVGMDVEKKFARDLVGRVRRQLEADEFHERKAINQQLEEEIESEFESPPSLQSPEDGPLIVPFVGPTGVGKTTTIAKLAAYYSVEESRSVGFVTLDGYRLAAVEQLRRYADILRVPLRDVTDNDDVDRAIEELVEQDVEIIFVDTAGRSQFDDDKIGEIEDVFPDEYPVKTHLVVSAKCRSRDLKDVLDGFERIGYDRLAVTKLDETKAHGTVYNLLRRSDQPMAYFTDGQEVPDDLWIAESGIVSDLIVEGEDDDG
jgi:flagellar biosynthesis protein FlhF